MSPQTIYECVGDVPNVIFPGATIQDPDTGRIVIYYGGADTVTGIAFTNIDDLIDFLKTNSI
jgi:beta-1,4-mannooligosaccharide/beta-1,4-mannosyl-N-acetylglucosamine phosphorylase